MATSMPVGLDTREQLGLFVELLGAYSSAVLTDRLLDEATGGGLTPTQYEALIFVNRHGGCSAKSLAEGLHISIPSSTRLVDRLVRKGLMDRREGDADRRLVRLSVTDAGRRALAAVHEARIARLEGALETFDPAERAQLFGLFERLLLATLRDVQTVDDCCLRCGTEHFASCVVNEAHLALKGRPIERI